MMHALEQIKGKRVMVVGDVVLDHYVMGDVERISPEAPVPVVRVQRENDMAGAAANVAMNLAALDARPIMVGVVGDDADGMRLREILQGGNVDCTYLSVSPGSRTTRKTRIIARSQHVARVDWDTILTAGAVQHCGVISGVEQAMPACDAIIVQDYYKGLIRPEILDVLKHATVPVIVDPNRYNPVRYCGTVLTPNIEEARVLSGTDFISGDAVERLGDIAKGLFARHGVQHVVVTLGDKGLALCSRDGDVKRCPVAKTYNVYDVSGAGDTVAAVLASALAAGVDLWLACRLANIGGALVVGKMGTATASRQEIQALADEIGFKEQA